MTQPAPAENLLSRDEMDALLEELAAARREDAEQRTLFGGQAAHGYDALRRSLEEFAESYSKRLSTAYQRRIDWLLRDTAAVDPRDVVETAAPGELFWVVELAGSGVAWLTWSRSLVFAWLQIAFGAPEPRGLAPSRPYTAIERSFLTRLAHEAVAMLTEPLRAHNVVPTEVGSLQGSRELLAYAGTTFVQAQFEVRGFGDFGQVRFALPAGGMSARAIAPAAGTSGPHRAHSGAVLQAPVALHAELGSAEITVESLACLRTGDVLPLQAPADGSLLLKVGDAPKFRARRGAVGERLAVQVTERIEESR